MPDNIPEEIRGHSTGDDPSVENDPIDRILSSRVSKESDMSANADGLRDHSSIEDPPLEDEPFQDAASSINHSEYHFRQWEAFPEWFNHGWGGEKDNFEVLLKPLLDLDTKQCAVWKEEVQNLRILAGLFSAIVTAFVIESYQSLQPNPNDQIISLLSRIADQSNALNGSGTSVNGPHADPPISTAFFPSPSDIRINIYWFISLVLSLTVALIGIITLQWLREHQRYENNLEATQMFAILNARSHGLKRWYVPQIFAGLPLVLQAALALFFIGLVEFLFSIQIDVAIPVCAAVAIPIVFLIATTVLPTLHLFTLYFPRFLRVNDQPPAPCPYKSPQALIVQSAAIVSTTLFNLLASAFGALWIPFVVIIRLFVGRDKPFYGEHAPFSTDDHQYQYFRDRLRNAAANWTSMDMDWIAARTSYAIAIRTPLDVRHLRWPYVGTDKLTKMVGFYDWVEGFKTAARVAGPDDDQFADSLWDCLLNIFGQLSLLWEDPLDVVHRGTEVGMAMQTHLTALLRIITPYDYQQTVKLVELSQGGKWHVLNAFLAIMLDQAFSSDSEFRQRSMRARLITHMKLTRLYLASNTRELFMCSNLPGITPCLSLSSRHSLLDHRLNLEQKNRSWMQYISSCWTWTLRNMIIDARKMTPKQPFARKCTGSRTEPCGSTLHTESIVELTGYILLFQVPEDIQATSILLYELSISKPNPVQDRPFVLLIACAYINAVANVNQDSIGELQMLLETICEICGSLDPTLEARPSGTGRYWPCLESAFDYIRSHACNWPTPAASAVPQTPVLEHNDKAAENV